MNVKEILTADELKQICEKNNWLAAQMVIFDWVVVIATFALVGLYPNPFTMLLAIVVFGARMQAFGVVVHECGHRNFFTHQALNDFVGNWLAGYWIFSEKGAYMRGHIKHHQNAGTDQDPDLKNYQSYPVSRESLRRKITRDLTGQVGWRRIKSIGRALSKIGTFAPEPRKHLLRSVAVNLFMLIVLTLFGAPWLYLLWVIAFITSHMLVVRIRQIAEHAAVPDYLSPDPRKNTRTIRISRLERFFVAPHHVNFHLEHHILASVPAYRLSQMHSLLVDKGYYDKLEFNRGYLHLLRQVSYA